MGVYNMSNFDYYHKIDCSGYRTSEEHGISSTASFSDDSKNVLYIVFYSSPGWVISPGFASSSHELIILSVPNSSYPSGNYSIIALKKNASDRTIISDIYSGFDNLLYPDNTKTSAVNSAMVNSPMTGVYELHSITCHYNSVINTYNMSNLGDLGNYRYFDGYVRFVDNSYFNFTCKTPTISAKDMFDFVQGNYVPTPNLTTNWKLYIDGTKNPLYKLTWDCVNVQNSDTSKVKVLFCGMDDAVPNTYIVKDSHYYDFNNKSVKLNYHDIYESVWGNLGGLAKSPVTIIVQFEYYEKPTVIPTGTSSYMYCELYPNETDGNMYGNIGYCKVGEHSTWFVKTESGDGSTFTAHDGTEGSEGYTKDDDKGYDDEKDKDDADSDTTVLSSGIGVLTSTFHMTKERLKQLGQFLWGSSVFDEFSLINNNPIENIISCKAIPYNISGTTQEITLGNVKTGVNGEKISQNFSKQTIGTVTINEHYKSFLDYAPYTNVIIYLPYIGFKELDTSLVMGKTLKIEYTLDVITGGCLAQIYVGNIRLYEFTGNIGVDISITASNRAQVESAYINAGVGVVSSAMSGNVTGAVNSIIGAATSQYHYSGTGNPSPSCVASTNRTCYVVIDRPQYQALNAFNHTRGRMCCLSKTIGSLKGYTVCDSNVDISGISATDEEKEEIVNILSSGFFA